MRDEQIAALENARRWAFSLPREQFEMMLVISNDASRKGAIVGATEERRRIVAWLFNWYDSGSVDGLICRSDGPDDFAAMLAQETQP